MAPPFREVEFDIIYGEGISREGELLDLATEANIVDKSGAWYSYEGERIGQGRENVRDFLREHPETFDSIEAKLLAHYNIRRIGIDGSPGGPAAANDSADAVDAVAAAAASTPAANGKRPRA
jgi:recombination protein RecA